MRISRGRAWACLTVILLAAGALRGWYVLALPGQGKDLIYSDMNAYDYSGWQMVRGLPVVNEPGFNGYHPLSASTYYYAGYTYFVAAVYAVFGHDPAALRVTQAVLGTATVGLVYLVGALTFGRVAGLFAAVLTGVDLPLVYYEGLILSETWFIFLQMAALALWLRAWGKSPEEDVASGGSSLGLATVAGVVAGVACLSRTAFLGAVVAMAAGAAVWGPSQAAPRRRLAMAAAWLAGAAVAIAPVTVRNYQIHDRFILISTNGPSTFLTGHVTHVGALPADTPRGISDVAMADRHKARIALYLADNWLQYLAEIPEFFESIWLSDEFWPATTTLMRYERIYDVSRPSRIKSLIDMTKGPPAASMTHFPDLTRYVDRIVWLLIGLPMGLLAALFLPRRDRRWLVLYLALLPYVIIPFIAPPFGRYRMPAVPLIFVLAGHSLTVCWACRSRLETRKAPE
jgi:4-amino-4-deoxy-L-arabinose transferase-like glycosyltransferase